jgi:thioredoxin 1
MGRLARIPEHSPASLQVVLDTQVSLLLVHFGTDWCAPCKRLERVILELMSEWGEAVMVGKVNTEDHPELAKAFRVARNPTLCVFREGRLTARQEGCVGKDVILRLLDLDTNP